LECRTNSSSGRRVVASTCLPCFPTFSGLSPPRSPACGLSSSAFSAAPFPFPFYRSPTTVNISATATMLSSFLGLVHFILLPATRLLPCFSALQFLLPEHLAFIFLCSVLSPGVSCCFAALLIVQTWHYCFLRPTTRKHNVNRGQAGLRPAYSGHIWVTGSEWEGKPIPFQSTLPYRHCSSAFVDYSAFLYCLQMRKIKSGKSEKGGEKARKSANLERSS